MNKLLPALLLITFSMMSCKSDKANKSIDLESPNILFILADDFGIYDLSFMGSKFYETPNIDRLAAQGTVFTQGYAASRVCSPSRASIMNGQFTGRHQITDWIGARSGVKWREHNRNDRMLPPEYNRALDDDHISLAEAMKLEGYTTFFAGKWHLGDTGSDPEDHGFDINKGGWKVGSPIGGYFSPWENPKLPNVKDGENLSMRLAKETADFISTSSKEPFFAMLSFYAVHGPIQTSEVKWSKYRAKADSLGIASSGFKMERVLPIRTEQDNPVYAGLVEQMDDAIGLVLDKLEEKGIADNTIVVFTSDNGGVASGDSYSTSNTPLRGGKGYQWEGGIREPYIIKVPGVSTREVDYPVSGIDFYPTLIDLIGAELPEDVQVIDGISLKPLFENQELEERPLFWHYPHYGNQGGEPSSIVRSGLWKLIHYYEDGRNELYELSADPSETYNLASDEPEKVEELSDLLNTWLDEVGANMPETDEEFDPVLAKENHRKKVEELMPRLERRRKEYLNPDFDPKNKWWGSKTID